MKTFMDKCNQERINYASGKEVWEKNKKINLTIALTWIGILKILTTLVQNFWTVTCLACKVKEKSKANSYGQKAI